MKKIVITLLMLCTSCFAQTFDFTSKGEEYANEILKEYISKDFEIYDCDTIAYYYDVDNDGEREIIGIVKAAPFYSLAGYRLFIIRKQDDEWQSIKSDIYFDNFKKLSVNDNEISYNKTCFYKHRKYHAKYKDNEFKTSGKFMDYFANKKASVIQQVTDIQQVHAAQVINVDDLKGTNQPSFYLDLTNQI